MDPEEDLQLGYYAKYNPNNKRLTTEFVNKMLNDHKIDQKISRIDLYQIAVTHKSYAVDAKKYSLDEMNESVLKIKEDLDNQIRDGKIIELCSTDYERIEFLGDKIIDAIVSEYVYDRFPENQEGFLTKLKSKLVRSETLALLSKSIKLHEYILLSKNVELRHGRMYACYLEDALEGFMGALYKDLGYLVCRKFFRYIMEEYVNFVELIMRNENYKDLLLKFFQKNGWGDPRYKQISVNGPPHNRIFTVSVIDQNLKVVGQGYGPNKKKAEQNSAKSALVFYGAF